jgi:hypothetical protein
VTADWAQPDGLGECADGSSWSVRAAGGARLCVDEHTPSVSSGTDVRRPRAQDGVHRSRRSSAAPSSRACQRAVRDREDRHAARSRIPLSPHQSDIGTVRPTFHGRDRRHARDIVATEETVGAHVLVGRRSGQRRRTHRQTSRIDHHVPTTRKAPDRSATRSSGFLVARAAMTDEMALASGRKREFDIVHGTSIAPTRRAQGSVNSIAIPR